MADEPVFLYILDGRQGLVAGARRGRVGGVTT